MSPEGATVSQEELFVGIDGEMSGNDIIGGHRLIQIGAAIHAPDDVATFSSVINPSATGDWWSEEAAAVHGLTIEQVLSAPVAETVDLQLEQWLLDHGAAAGYRRMIPVGFNVMAFDMPFIRQALPRSAALFSRRGVDLNAICYFLSGWDARSATGPAWTGWRRSAKRAVHDRALTLCPGADEHDAGFDAVEALLAFGWLREQLPAPVAPRTRTRAALVPPALALALDLDAPEAVLLADLLTGHGVDNAGQWLNQTRDPRSGKAWFAVIRAEGLGGFQEWISASPRVPWHAARR